MPFDLDSILSSSPPGFELNLDIGSDFARVHGQFDGHRKQLQFDTKAQWCAPRYGTKDLEEELDANTSEASDCESEQRGLVQADTGWLDEHTSRRISSWESYYQDCDIPNVDGDECGASEGRLSRKVHEDVFGV